ncbi:hypothetical protein FPOAC1_006917 [Fusarium poae]|uniref:hypothetical protein n=1 Tax=Fusarium poae TaxID=36050 RepID=UPI001CEBF2E8|nr:hypothetical protein FPOAC1_006917 [Fusarium poae]KAG8673603.1 hypothetical protein FPOAC1_006917 [Fusarium poae]
MLYSLADVLAVAKTHPFYSDAKYPPTDEAIRAAREKASIQNSQPNYLSRSLIKPLFNLFPFTQQETSTLTPGEAELKARPLLHKHDLYDVIEKLVNDVSPENTYRRNVYTSVTGGGSTLSRPLFFATDALENRRHRAYFGEFLNKTGLIESGDWVVTIHCGGSLYRSLDLTLETMENAGASVLAAGSYSKPFETVDLLKEFNVNVLTGDGSQIMAVIHYISTLKKEDMEKIKLNKVIYTSEALTVAQKAHIYDVLGPVKICSVLGSAEAGPYGVSTPELTPSEPGATYNDFIIDTRMTLIEILPIDYAENKDIPVPDLLPEGETGVIAQTVLTRLRNPVVRYVTGDVGSLHPLPEQTRSQIPQSDLPYLRVLRLHGRDRRFSFMWDGFDTRFDNLATLLSEEQYGVLQWQVILSKMEPSLEAFLEIRLLCKEDEACRQAALARLNTFLNIYPPNAHKFKVTFVDGLNGFELSKTGQKVIKFIDRSA